MSQDNASDAGGFFSRWSQRKQAVKQGINLPEAQAADSNQADKPLPLQQASAGASDPLQTVQESAPVPTLEDVAKLTPESDFSSYMTQNVPAEVKNAAVKKLFADPHFNIMDGLDIYIGDYNTPDPLPEGMLAKMVGAQFLGLVKAPEDVAQSDTSPSVSFHPPEAQLSASAEITTDAPAPLKIDPVQHDHTHLRLQSDDAPAAPEAGPSAG
ncbi:MAG: hypothetical protein RL462_928 [Pseudomonadota bacterium]|jgi:hypothetical protein